MLVQNVAAPLLRLHAHNNGALCLGFRKRCSCEIENKVDCLIFWPGRSPGEGKGYLVQYSGLENSKDCIVHGVAKNWSRLSNLTFT